MSALALVFYCKTLLISILHTVSPERAHTVGFTPGGLLFVEEETRTIDWSPDTIVPPHLVSSANQDNIITVNITLYQQDLIRGPGIQYKWRVERVLLTEVPNNGQANVTLPSNGVSCKYPTLLSLDFEVCPVALKVSLASVRQAVKYTLPKDLGQWSGIGFLKDKGIKDDDLRKACEEWGEHDTGSSRLATLIPCPPTIQQSRLDPRFEEILLTPAAGSSDYPQNSMSLFHPNSIECYNEAV